MWVYGFKVAALGMSVVFTALIMLMFLIKAQSFLINFFTKKADDRKAEKLVEVSETESTAASIVIEDNSEEDPEELIAVISAAIFALGHEVSIKKIKRLPGHSGSNWSHANRIEAMNTHKR